MRTHPDGLSVPLPLRPKALEQQRRALVEALRGKSLDSLVAELVDDTPESPVTQRILSNLAVLYTREELAAWSRAKVRAVLGGSDRG